MPFKLLLALLITQGLLIQGLAIRGQSPAISGQSPAFGVYSTIGNIKCIPSRGPARLVGPHSWLAASDKLILEDNISEIILFDHDSGYIRLHGKGVYTTAEIEKMQRTRIGDTLITRYLSLSWAAASPQKPALRSDIPTQTSSVKPAPRSSNLLPSSSIILAPRSSYATSIDSIIFRWRNTTWAQKYFLRLRGPDGQICYDTVVIDTQAVVHFDNRMPAGKTYEWALDIVGMSGRLQFADSSHIILVNETAVLAQLPTVIPDSIGGIAVILQRIEQLENAGCTKEADAMLQQLTTTFPQDIALNQLYLAFRRRNYY